MGQANARPKSARTEVATGVVIAAMTKGACQGANGSLEKMRPK